MDALAFDFAPGRTGPPPDIPVARPGHRATTVEKNWRSNSAIAPLELFLNFDKAVARVHYDVRDVDAPQILHLHGALHPPYLGPTESDAAVTSDWSAVLRPSLSRLGALFQPNVDAARLAYIYLTACDTSASAGPGSSAVELHPSLSLCLRALYERQSVLTEAQAAALKRQLRVLLEDEEELQSANISVSIPSLHRLIDFLSVHQTSALPSLSITRAGYFAASWSPRKRVKLTIVFRPEGVADWIASDLSATPPVHQKDTLANRLGEFAAWTNA
jgi:hypothetical protein